MLLLVTHAQPIIKSIIRKNLRVSLSATDGRSENQDALELSAEIQTRVLQALRRISAGRGQVIGNFPGYVATTAHHACHEFLRRKYPQRHSLKNKLRYIIERHEALSVWESDGITLCGMSVLRYQKKAPLTAAQLSQLLETASNVYGPVATQDNLRALHLQGLVFELFSKAGAPVELNNLVCAVADLLEIKDDSADTKAKGDDEDGGRFETLSDESSNHYLKLEGRLYLERLWSEICALPVRQRAAILLNLRDPQGNGLIHLFPITGVATMRNLADALEMAADELAGLWNELPLTDAAISSRLQVTRQQVINLRKCARERLARRMRTL
ncbi:MAG TPA: hypothetical protein VF717_08215 [Pyrinomonadaceae bacterium]